MKNKMWKIAVSALALIFSALSAAIGFGYMGESSQSFLIRFLCGLVLIATPLLVIQLLILFFRKEDEQ